MDSRCLQGNKPAKKEEKDSGKTKSADFPSVDVPSGKSTHQNQANPSQTNKKDQDHQRGFQRRRRWE